MFFLFDYPKLIISNCLVFSRRVNPFDQTSCTSLSSEQAGFLCDYEVRFLGSQQVKTDRGVNTYECLFVLLFCDYLSFK